MTRKRVIITIGVAVAAAVFVALPAFVNASAFSADDNGEQANGQTCEMQNWPYYARACLRDDTGNAGGRAIKPRIVSTDQLDRSRTRAVAAENTAVNAPRDKAP